MLLLPTRQRLQFGSKFSPKFTNALSYNKATPYAQGLKCLVNWQNDQYPVNLVTGRMIVQSNPGFQNQMNSTAGMGQGSQGAWNIAPATEVYGPTSTFIFIRQRFSAVAQPSSFLGDGTLNVHLPWSDGNVYWDYPSGADRATWTGSIVSNIVEVWCLQGGSPGRSIWLNGIKRTLDVNPTTVANPSSGATFQLNTGSSPGEDCYVFAFASWARWLADDEIRAISDDFHGKMFETNERPLMRFAAQSQPAPSPLLYQPSRLPLLGVG